MHAIEKLKLINEKVYCSCIKIGNQPNFVDWSLTTEVYGNQIKIKREDVYY